MTHSVRFLLLSFLTLLLLQPAEAQRRKKRDQAPPPAAETPTVAPAALPTPPPSADDAYARQRRVFEQALRYNDGDVALSAFYQMMALRPDDVVLKDTLAYLYYDLNKFANALFVTRELTAKRPGNTGILELKGLTERKLGLLPEALATYQRLYASTQNLLHLYEQATIQYQLKRLNEFELSLNMLMEHPDLAEQTLTLQGAGQTSQEVPMRAAVLNLRGVLHTERGKMEEARTAYQEALKIAPAFELAKDNLAALEQPAE
ncbi:MAG: tetratricopeptide repeat protein [Catalinimonas sp.]